ncbi:hypothetical protein DOTSEDRAFT_70245, partial [Dothistroma septosporum NZE10]
MAHNNTYGFEVVSAEAYANMTAAWSGLNGCRDLVEQCRALGHELDPDFLGSNLDVNLACYEAFVVCYKNVAQGSYDRSPFDMAHTIPDPFPHSCLIGFFSRAWVQQHLGVPLNFTANSNLVSNNFFATGDFVRFEGLRQY